jgi:hypothetical protein
MTPGGPPQQHIAKGTDTFVAGVRGFFLILSLAVVVLNAWFLYYVDELKRRGCQCALGWRRTFMQASLMVFILMGILGFVMDWKKHFLWLAALFNLITIAYVIVTREFINDIKGSSCKCAETDAFEVLGIVNIIQIFFLVLAVVALLGMLFFWSTVGRGVSKARLATAAGAVGSAAAARRRRR